MYGYDNCSKLDTTTANVKIELYAFLQVEIDNTHTLVVVVWLYLDVLPCRGFVATHSCLEFRGQKATIRIYFWFGCQ